MHKIEIEEASAMAEFAGAALPWVAMGLFVAAACAVMNRKEK